MLGHRWPPPPRPVGLWSHSEDQRSAVLQFAVRAWDAVGAIGLLAAAKFRRLLAQQECFVFPLLTVSAQFLNHWKMLGAPAADSLAPLPKDGGGQFLKPHYGQKFLFNRQSRHFMAAGVLERVAPLEKPP